MHVVLWALLALFVLSMTVGGLVGGANIIDELLGKVDPSKAIGKVNGEIISPNIFSQQVGRQLDQIRANGQSIDDTQINRIREQVWDNFVQDILIQQEVEDLGLVATDEEVIYHLQNNPPVFLQSQPSFQTDGQFDPAKYEQALANPGEMEQYWIQVENYMRNYIPRYKLQQMILSSVSVTESEIMEEYTKRNIDYTVDILHVTKDALDTESLSTTDEELLTSYNENIDDHNRPENRSLRYASWEKMPSNEDTTYVYDLALEIKNQALSGKDFASLANEYTEDPSNAVTPDSGKGGNLGWFGRGQMVPAFEEAAFSANKGEIVGPVLSRFGYHVIKVNGKKKSDGKEQVSAAHILFKIETSAKTLDEVRRKATLFSYDAQDFGFDAAVDSHDVSISDINNIDEETIYIPTLGPMSSAARFAFRNAVGQASEPLENDNFVAVFTIDSVIAAGPAPFDEIKEQIKREIEKDKMMTATEKLANDFRLNIENGTTFQELIDENEAIEHSEKDSKTLNRGFSSIGRSNFATGALLSATDGDLVGPVKTSRGFALLQVLEIETVDSTDFEIQKNVLKKTLLNQKQSAAYTNWIDGKKADAEIVDNRKYFF